MRAGQSLAWSNGQAISSCAQPALLLSRKHLLSMISSPLPPQAQWAPRLLRRRSAVYSGDTTSPPELPREHQTRVPGPPSSDQSTYASIEGLSEGEVLASQPARSESSL